MTTDQRCQASADANMGCSILHVFVFYVQDFQQRVHQRGMTKLRVVFEVVVGFVVGILRQIGISAIYQGENNTGQQYGWLANGAMQGLTWLPSFVPTNAR